MAELSPECLERLRDLEGQLGNMALRLDQVAPAQSTARLRLAPSDQHELLSRLPDPPADLDEDCREIFKALEPQIGLVVKAVQLDHPVDALRRHIEAARAYLRTVQKQH